MTLQNERDNINKTIETAKTTKMNEVKELNKKIKAGKAQHDALSKEVSI